MKREAITKDRHTIAEHRFKTTDGQHTLYIQEWGNKQGVPILFLHGGPGGGCGNHHKNFFDHQKHRVIFLDQRGSGNSRPYGSLKANDTDKLVEDIELVRAKLKIDSWHVEGLSWGSTLALVYAIRNPRPIKSLVILGVFLGSQEEINWIENGLYRTFYPEAYEEHPIKTFKYDVKADQESYLKIFLPILSLDDRKKQMPDEAEPDLAPIKTELYYLNNNCFIPENYILDNATKITAPVTIIQGRYDMVAPPISAYRLSKLLPNCTMHTTIAGHRSSDRETFSTLRAVLATLT